MKKLYAFSYSCYFKKYTIHEDRMFLCGGPKNWNDLTISQQEANTLGYINEFSEAKLITELLNKYYQPML